MPFHKGDPVGHGGHLYTIYLPRSVSSQTGEWGIDIFSHAFVIFVVLSFTEYEGRHAGPVMFSRFPSKVERSFQ